MKPTSKMLILIAAVVVLALAVYAGPGWPVAITSATTQTGNAALPAPVISIPRSSALSDLESAYQEIYTQVNPAVVLIQVVQQSAAAPNRPNPGFGLPQSPAPAHGLGSGFVWDNQGNIVTNNHVVEGATQITVTFADGTLVPAKVVGVDSDSDLAVVKVDAPSGLLRPVQVADSASVRVGQLAIAIGNPFGEQNTMTTGIISALGRSLPAGNDNVTGPTFKIPDVIQTDAPINPGNSGGVLLNAQGQVIGVTSAIESGTGSSAGIGFAIPSAIVQKVIPALIKTGRYDHPYLGISGTSLYPAAAQAMGLKADQRGALVSTVTDGGPAAKAGVRGSKQQATIDGRQTLVGGDVIVAMDGQPVRTFDDVVAYLARSTQVNQAVSVRVLREGKEQDISVTLGARPRSQTAQQN